MTTRWNSVPCRAATSGSTTKATIALRAHAGSEATTYIDATTRVTSPLPSHVAGDRVSEGGVVAAASRNL